MKAITYISLAILIFEGCNTKQDQQIKSLSMQDSVLMRSTVMKDSTITAYVKTINDVQDNLDSIKAAEKILSVNSFGSENKRSIVGDIRIINIQLLKYHREIYSLEKKLKLMDSKNKEIQKLEIHLANELAEKDSAIAALQGKLAKMNDSLVTVIEQFNDSMKVINSQNGLIADLTTQINTVYYAVGTTKEFKKNNVITKDGGFIGIGRTSEMKKNFNTEYFAKEDMTKLTIIPLMGKFDKILTNHPGNSYTVTNNHKSDSLVIKSPALFWSISKYLVVVIK